MRLDFERTIRTVCDGFLTEENYNSKGVYLGFDFRLATDEGNRSQRSVAVGLHFIRFWGRILGAANRDFLFPRFHPRYEWESISTHDSCWSDSTNHWVGEIIQDIMEKRDSSEYVDPYKGDNLTYGKYDIWLSMGRSMLIDIKELKEVMFTDPHSNSKDKRPLIRHGVCLSA